MKKITNSCQVQIVPKPGQLLMYVELSEIKKKSIDETIDMLEAMGYAPTLRYWLAPQGILSLYAVLRVEQHDPLLKIPDDYYQDEMMALYDAFPGEESVVRCSRGLPQKVAIAA
jgi:hypothetical protein